MLAVAADVVVYGYVTGWLGGATNNPRGTKGQLQFDLLYANTTHVTAFVRNVGQKEISLSKVYVERQNKTFSLSDYVLRIGEVSGEIVVSHTMTSGLTSEVKVTCRDGASISQSVEAKG